MKTVEVKILIYEGNKVIFEKKLDAINHGLDYAGILEEPISVKIKENNVARVEFETPRYTLNKAHEFFEEGGKVNIEPQMFILRVATSGDKIEFG